MTKEELVARLKKPEWSDLECKRSRNGVSEDAYRTVSAFSNTEGGSLVFGVKDSLIVDFAHRDPGRAPDGAQMQGPFATASYDFVLAPA